MWITLITTVGQFEKVPGDWTRGIVVRIFKKGDALNCDNWRGINLISVPSKVVVLVILERLKKALDPYLREEQHGFWTGRSCSDLIFTLRILIEEANEWSNKVYMLFIDFEKAFDSVDRDTLWEILQYYGVPKKIISLIMAFYENTECCIKTENGTTSYFKIMSGVRQGCVLSPFLFVILMDYVLREAAGFGITVGNKILSDLDFADDVALLEMTKQRLQELLNKVSVKAEKVGLNINIDKTKSMATSGSPFELQHKNRRVEQVHEFKYLGSWVDYTGEVQNEVKRRNGMANAAFNKIKPVWKSKKCSIALKLQLLNSNVLSVLFYASICWKLDVGTEKRLTAFENMCLRRVMGIGWRQRVSNIEVRRRTGQPLITEVIKKK